MKRLAVIVGCVVGVVLIAGIAAALLVDANSFRPLLEQKLTQALARDVKLGDLKLSLFSGAVTASDLSIADNPAYSHAPFLQAKSLGVGVELWPLILSKQLHVTSLVIDHPSVSLIQAADGEWNFSNLGGSTPAKANSPETTSSGKLDLSVKLVKMTGGRFSLGHSGSHQRPLVLEDVDLEVKDFSPTSEFPFTIAAKLAGGGKVKLDGKTGPLNPTDTAATPFHVSLNVDKLDLAVTGLTQNAPAIAGLISLDGSCSSDGKAAQVQGKIKAEKLKLAKGATPAKRDIAFDFAANHNWRKRNGKLERGNIHVGSAAATLTGTYAAEGESTAMHMVFDGPKMSLPELETMLPALDIVLPHGSS